MSRLMKYRYLFLALILAWCSAPRVGANGDTVCGGEYYAANGTIMLLDYGHANKSGAMCEWQITVPEGHVVLLRLLDIDIQSRLFCSQYSFYVRDASDIYAEHLPVGSCEKDLAEPIISPSNSLWIEFNPLDAIQPVTRFHAEWTSVQMSCNAGWILSKFSKGAVKSCAKPAIFDRGEERYNTAVMTCAEYNAHLVTITSEQQESRLINSMNTNVYYFIGLRRNGTNSWTWITGDPYNYTQLKGAESTVLNCVSIHVSNFFGVTQKGVWYLAKCTNLHGKYGYICEHDISDGNQCGGIYTMSSGTISSQNYPSTYNMKERCEWKIATSHGNVILLVFTHMDITKSSGCKSDYIKVSEGMGSHQNVLHTICGDDNPGPIGTTVNSAWIEFKSSDLSPRTGFQLHWATTSCTYNCDKQLQAESYIIKNGDCKLQCRSQNTESNNKYVCQQRCAGQLDFDHNQCGHETDANNPCCTVPQCVFTIALFNAVTATVMSELMTEQDTPEVLTMKDSPYNAQGANVALYTTIPTVAAGGIVCAILIWRCRRRRKQGRNQSQTTCCFVTMLKSRGGKGRQNDIPALSPILETILEHDVGIQIKLQSLLMREDLVLLGEQLGRDNCIGSDISAFVDEAITMAEFSHIHVLSVIGVCINRKTEVPMIVLPFMEHGDLRTYLCQCRQSQSEIKLPDEIQLLLFCLHIARGMTYLSGLKFIHRDLAARNCMLDSNMVVKVADFGLSKDVYSQSYYRQEHQKMLPIKWMALESLQDHVYTLYTDIWSYGVTVWEVMSLGKVPYTELDNSRVLEYLETGARLPRPKMCPDFLYKLMLSCWKEKPEDRPTFQQISKQISDYLAEKCDYLDLNMESDTNRIAEIKEASHIVATCSTPDYADDREPPICND